MEPADFSKNNFQLSKSIFVIPKLKMNLKAECQFWRNSLSVLVFVNKPRVDVKLLLYLQIVESFTFVLPFYIRHLCLVSSVQQSQSGFLILIMMITWGSSL